MAVRAGQGQTDTKPAGILSGAPKSNIFPPRHRRMGLRLRRGGGVSQATLYSTEEIICLQNEPINTLKYI